MKSMARSKAVKLSALFVMVVIIFSSIGSVTSCPSSPNETIFSLVVFVNLLNRLPEEFCSEIRAFLLAFGMIRVTRPAGAVWYLLFVQVLAYFEAGAWGERAVPPIMRLSMQEKVTV